MSKMIYSNIERDISVTREGALHPMLAVARARTGDDNPSLHVYPTGEHVWTYGRGDHYAEVRVPAEEIAAISPSL